MTSSTSVPFFSASSAALFPASLAAASASAAVSVAFSFASLVLPEAALLLWMPSAAAGV
jgi:hypothetical protein